MTKQLQFRENLISVLSALGYPEEFESLIADTLGTEKQIARMISWIKEFHPNRTEDIVDEMFAIKDEFEKYQNKKVLEYCNKKYNNILNFGLEDEDENF